MRKPKALRPWQPTRPPCCHHDHVSGGRRPQGVVPSGSGEGAASLRNLDPGSFKVPRGITASFLEAEQFPAAIGVDAHGDNSGVEGLVHPPVRFENRGQEAAATQLGDLEIDGAHLGGEQARAPATSSSINCGRPWPTNAEVPASILGIPTPSVAALRALANVEPLERLRWDWTL